MNGKAPYSLRVSLNFFREDPGFDLARKFHAEVVAVAEACIKAKKLAADLTEEEKFAIAFCAGVPFHSTDEGVGAAVYRKFTTDPCAVVDDGKGYYKVLTLMPGSPVIERVQWRLRTS